MLLVFTHMCVICMLCFADVRRIVSGAMALEQDAQTAEMDTACSAEPAYSTPPVTIVSTEDLARLKTFCETALLG